MKSGTLTSAQHDILVRQVEQLYDLQRESNRFRERSKGRSEEESIISSAKKKETECNNRHSIDFYDNSKNDSVSRKLQPPSSSSLSSHSDFYNDNHSHLNPSSSFTSSHHDQYNYNIDSVNRPPTPPTSHRTLLPNPPLDHAHPSNFNEGYPPSQRGPGYRQRAPPPPRGNFRPRGGGPPRHHRGRDRPYSRPLPPFRGHSPPPRDPFPVEAYPEPHPPTTAPQVDSEFFVTTFVTFVFLCSFGSLSTAGDKRIVER